eukprot:TRINITY_DN3429_c0_g1_i1.p1 TRINITY_DN3429_c0_g1~~TRINITY_DN3429_c0_g1_i1.p1  ORF type:complete len:219 (-),score=32.68 TRINITY_DN3429_c0_g1_i1:53-709(-)
MSGEVVFKVLTPNLVSKAVDCISSSFAHADPFTQSLGFSKTQWGILSQMFVQRAAKKELSFVAMKGDEVEGVILNEDWKENPPEYYSSLEDWRPVRAIFNELHTRFKAASPRIENGKVLHPLYFTCVRPEMRRHHIVSNLWDRTVKVAQEHNYETIVSEASSPTTEKVLCDKFGFKEVTCVNFQDFQFEGQRIYEPLLKSGYKKLCILQRSITSDLFI